MRRDRLLCTLYSDLSSRLETFDKMEQPVAHVILEVIAKAAYSTAGRGVRRAATRAEAVSAWRALGGTGTAGDPVKVMLSDAYFHLAKHPLFVWSIRFQPVHRMPRV